MQQMCRRHHSKGNGKANLCICGQLAPPVTTLVAEGENGCLVNLSHTWNTRQSLRGKQVRGFTDGRVQVHRKQMPDCRPCLAIGHGRGGLCLLKAWCEAAAEELSLARGTCCAALHCHHMARHCTWGPGQTRHVIDIQGSRGRCTMHQVCPRVVAYDAWRCRLVNAMKSDITDCETVA